VTEIDVQRAGLTVKQMLPGSDILDALAHPIVDLSAIDTHRLVMHGVHRYRITYRGNVSRGTMRYELGLQKVFGESFFKKVFKFFKGFLCFSVQRRPGTN